jgi:predicted anti-sigma-YlaC factor YlaD
MKRIAGPRTMKPHAWRVALAGLCLIVAASGCSVRQYAASSIGNALVEGGDVYASDDDIELVGAAIPFGLKTIESLLATVPEHRGLLLAATRGFTQYAYVYVQLPADELEARDVAAAYAQRDRARRLFLRARDYGLRGLGLAGSDAARRLFANPAGTLATTTVEDVPLLYWTAVAWAAAISLGKDSPALVAGLPAVGALIARASELDTDWDHGTLQTFLIGYEMSRPDAAPDAERRARAHFARAVELSAGQQAAPYVSLAESVSIEHHDRREFDALLAKALGVDPEARPEWKLANLVMQRRARWLRARADEFFPE